MGFQTNTFDEGCEIFQNLDKVILFEKVFLFHDKVQLACSGFAVSDFLGLNQTSVKYKAALYIMCQAVMQWS